MEAFIGLIHYFILFLQAILVILFFFFNRTLISLDNTNLQFYAPNLNSLKASHRFTLFNKLVVLWHENCYATCLLREAN